MIVRRTIALCLSAGLLAAPAVLAHHSWSAEYDLTKSTVLTGTVARFAFENPHSTITIDVVNADGQRERWTAGWSSPQRLRERGIGVKWLRAGDEVYVVGNPHRDAGTRALRVQSLERLGDTAH